MQLTPAQKSFVAWSLIVVVLAAVLWRLSPVLTPFVVASLLAVQSRLLLLLEGGYHTSALPASVLAVLRVLIDATGPGGPGGYRPSGHDAGTAASDEVRRLLGEVQKLHGL